MDFRILGRFEVLDAGRELALGGAKQRAVLVVLLLHRRDVVSIDCLVDELWGERPPPTAIQTVRVYVSRLRKTLGDGVLETRGRGYRLAFEPDQIDAERFDALVADGRAALESGDAGRAAKLLAAALELWRGPPLEEFAYEPFAQGEIARLEEARLAALEDRVDAELRIGRGAELVAELEQLVAEHPLRERLVAGLMSALYRSGRQADAVAIYRATRQHLVEELGLEPGPALRDLEQRILRHDPTLARAGAAIRAPRPRGSRIRLAATTLALGAVVAAAFVFSTGAAQPGHPTIAGANGIVAINAASGGLVSATQLPGTPGAVSGGGGSVWVADPGAGDVSQIDPVSGVAVDKIPVDGGPGSIVSGGGAIWVASTDAATVTRSTPPPTA
jgi:DNA-binding SARP family transcriptional activator